MADMLVRLYALPEVADDIARLSAQSILIRPGAPEERPTIAAWAGEHFQASWGSGCEWALLRDPVSCHIAVEVDTSFVPSKNAYDLPRERLIGFSCYDTSAKGMFGPLGVLQEYRGKGIGRALLLTSLHAMRAERYAYAVIGWAGPTRFYEEATGATAIDGSEPGIYRGELIA
jgi:GNAT superfamily N-acetyltransferase